MTRFLKAALVALSTVAGGAAASAQTLQFCTPTIFGGIEGIGAGYYWYAFSKQFEECPNFDKPCTDRVWKEVSKQFVPGFEAPSMRCNRSIYGHGPATGSFYAQPSTRTWSCDTITETLICDMTSMDANLNGWTTEQNTACKAKIEAYRASGKLRANEVIPSDGTSRLYPYYLTCGAKIVTPVGPVEPVDPETTGVEFGVTIERPTLPKYSRDGDKLNKAFDDFTAPR